MTRTHLLKSYRSETFIVYCLFLLHAITFFSLSLHTAFSFLPTWVSHKQKSVYVPMHSSRLNEAFAASYSSFPCRPLHRNKKKKKESRRCCGPCTVRTASYTCAIICVPLCMYHSSTPTSSSMWAVKQFLTPACFLFSLLFCCLQHRQWEKKACKSAALSSTRSYLQQGQLLQAMRPG